MKKISLILFAATVALLVAGCQQPTSSTPTPPPADISKAPSTSNDKFSKAMEGLPLDQLSSLPQGITISGSYGDSKPVDATLTFTNYTADQGKTILNGTIKIKGSSTDTSAAFTISGSLAISGEVAGTVALNLAITMTSTDATIEVTHIGTCTIDGTTYTVDQSMTV